MAEGFRPILFTLIITGLFAMAIITCAIMFQSQNDFTGNVGDDPSLSEYKTSIEGNLTEYSRTTSTSDAVLSNSSITTSTSTPFVDSIGGIWKTTRAIPITVWDLTMGLALEKLFGGNKGLILTVLGALLTLAVVFAVVYLISTGDSK